jgi:hypothetical protein
VKKNETAAEYDEFKGKLQSTCEQLNLTFSTVDADSNSQPTSPGANPGGDQKFDIRQLVFGRATIASEGIMSLLCVDDMQVYGELSGGIKALDVEIEKNGTEEDKECYNYVKNEEAGSSNVLSAHGYKRDCDRDTGHVLPERQIDDPAAPGGKRGMKLNDFAKHEIAKTCKLTEPEVLVLRFYTTAGYKTINNSLRDKDRLKKSESHPLPLMVFLLSTAVKKLRTAFAESAESKFDLFRGMSHVELESEFLKKGGTELAPMSTTKDMALAIKFSSGGARSVLLRVRTTGFMNLGAQLGWLSVYPFEVEYLYPPATFLKILRNKPWVIQIGGAIVRVVDVQPQLP